MATLIIWNWKKLKGFQRFYVFLHTSYRLLLLYATRYPWRKNNYSHYIVYQPLYNHKSSSLRLNLTQVFSPTFCSVLSIHNNKDKWMMYSKCEHIKFIESLVRLFNQYEYWKSVKQSKDEIASKPNIESQLTHMWSVIWLCIFLKAHFTITNVTSCSVGMN